MIIDEEALNKSDFFLYSDEDMKNEQYIDNIDVVIDKYDINTNSNTIMDSNENKFIAIINHATNLYYKKKDLPEDIGEIFINNFPFKETLNRILEKKLQNLIKNDSAIFFKDITTMVHLLCLSEKYEVFKSYNNYDYDAISNLFRFYENLLREQALDNKDLFTQTFNSYTILLRTYTQLCVINATDLVRKKTINKIIDLMTETINMLKFSLTLNEKEMNKINNILGEHLYYFSHVSYIQVRKDDINSTLKEFHLYLEKQADGYFLSKSTNFGDDGTSNKNEEFIIFKSNASFLLLTLLQKLKFTFKDVDYFNNKNFKKIIESYYENFSLKIKEDKLPSNVTEFKTKLLDSLLYNYQIDIENTKVLNHHTIIDDFIFSGHNFENRNLETTHNILLFSNDIEDYKYIHIGQLLVATSSIQNDYYEFFKLKTLDIIMNYFMNKKHTVEIEELLNKIHEYVKRNKTASHLLSMYSKLYLSLCFYYSYHVENLEYIQKAKTYYAIFIQTNGIKTLKNEYKYINNNILLNFGKYYANESKLTNLEFTTEQYIEISKNMTKQYLLYRELELKFDINKGITDLTNRIYKNSNISYNEINKVLTDLISRKIFHGLAEVFILGLADNNSKIFDAGYKQYIIKMNEQYSIQFIFPTVYEENFKYILNYNKIFIESNISNILLAFTQNNINYIDNITGLYNFIKLDEVLREKENKIGFIEIYIESLFNLNRVYGYEKGNDIFRLIGEKIESLCKIKDTIHKLNGARIGVLLDNSDDYKQIIEELKDFEIKIDGEDTSINLYATMTLSSKEDIIKKSSKNMDKAIINKIKQIVDIY